MILVGTVLSIPAAAQEQLSIINVHEHLQSLNDAKRVLPLMDELGISKTVLLGSPRQTFYPGAIKGQRFDESDKNNRLLLFVRRKYPERFVVFCVFHQDDPKISQKTKSCLKRGASGVKLFSGHGTFYTIPLNDPLLFPYYEFLEKESVPILWHVNTGKYFDEFKSVLERYPRLKIICAHYCLASKNLSRLRFMLENYPNIFFDTSFGAPRILRDGTTTITQARDEFHELFMNYPGRFLFGTDHVVTKVKTAAGIRENFKENQAMLEEVLQLPNDVLKKIYEENWYEFMNKK